MSFAGARMIDDFRLRGSRTWRRMGGHLTKRGWRTRWRTLLTTPTLLSQRAKSSPLWSRLCPGIRIGSGLARILRILCGKAPCGAGPPRTARRGAAQEGEEVEGATPCFLPLVRHRAGGGGAPEWSHHLPSPAGVAPSTVIPCGKASRRPFALMEGECLLRVAL